MMFQQPRPTHRGQSESEQAAASVDPVLRSPGQPLAEEVRTELGTRLGADFSRVRVHADGRAAASARAVGANAYTVGDHIVFGDGRYAPHTRDGRHLLAHELTHVVQQGGIGLPAQLSVGATGHAGEREADQAAAAVTAGATYRAGVVSVGRPLIQRQPSEAAAPTVPVPKFPDDRPWETWLHVQPITRLVSEIETVLLGQDLGKLAVEVLDYYWIRDTVDAVKLITAHGYLPKLTAYAHGGPLHRPMVDAVVKQVTDPDKVTEADVTSVGTDREPEMRALNKLDSWVDPRSPWGLPRSAETSPDKKGAAPPKAERTAEQIRDQSIVVDYIRRNRAQLAERRDLKTKKSGYFYNGRSGDPLPEPVAATAPGSVQRGVWHELAGEGHASSVNAWDINLLTLGHGFTGSLLGAVLTDYFRKTPTARRRLLSVGFMFSEAEQKWLYVDEATGTVLENDAAKRKLRTDTRILSLLIDIREGDTQSYVNSEWSVLAVNAGNVPAAARAWPRQVMLFAAHTVHWVSVSWGTLVRIGPTVKGIIRQIATVPRLQESVRGGAILLTAQTTATIRIMGRPEHGGPGHRDGVAVKELGTPAPLPSDIDQPGKYSGHVFLRAGKAANYFHLGP